MNKNFKMLKPEFMNFVNLTLREKRRVKVDNQGSMDQSRHSLLT